VAKTCGLPPDDANDAEEVGLFNLKGRPAFAGVVAELMQTGELGRRCRCRTVPYSDTIVEQDRWFMMKRIAASRGFRSVAGACRTIEGYQAVHAILKGQVRRLAKSDALAQRQLIHTLFGIAE